MGKQIDRRQILKTMGAACAAGILPGKFAGASLIGPSIANQDTVIRISAVSEQPVHLSAVTLRTGKAVELPKDG